MIRRLPATLCLLGALAGCDDSGLSNVARREMFGAKELLAGQSQSGAVLLEIHGLPWPGAAPEEIAGTLRMPEGPGREIRFHPVPPGQGRLGGGARLVLHFNPVAGGPAACTAAGEMPSGEGRRGGFVVTGTYCRDTEWVVQATLRADVPANDWLAYYLEMQKLLGAMFPNR